MSDKRQETIADIIASKRLRAAEMEKTLGDQHSFVESLKDDADRIEAAWRREKSVIEADALSAGGLVEAMRQKEAICTKCRDGEPPKNCRFFGEPDGCSSPTYGHYPQLPIGDCAKLREFARLVSHMNDDGYWNGSASICALVDKAKAALAEPPRNCDKYENDNAIEQFEREILGKEAATTYERLENMRENWFRYNSWLFEKAKERRGDGSPRTGQEGT